MQESLINLVQKPKYAIEIIPKITYQPLQSIISILIVFDIYFARGQKDLPQPCDTPNSEIYCKGGVGSLLHTVQLAKIYENDTTRPDKSSKTFVDQPIKYPVKNVLDNFKTFMVSVLTL